MKLTEKVRKLFAVAFMAAIGTVGVQDVDADGAADFTVRGRRRPLVERPVERDDPDGDRSPFCILDIETTGFSPERDSIIEIAVIRTETEDGIARERVLNELVRPAGNIPRRIRELTGITNETVADADTIDRVLSRVAAFVGDAPIVAHNAHFDRRFLEHNARLMGMTFSRNEWVCTMSMAQRVPVGRPYKLGALAERLDVAEQGSHRALDDCRATIGVYRAVRRLLGGSASRRWHRRTTTTRRQRRSRTTRTCMVRCLSSPGSATKCWPPESDPPAERSPAGSPGRSRHLVVLVVDPEAKPTGKVKKAREYGIAIRSKEGFEAEFYIAP